MAITKIYKGSVERSDIQKIYKGTTLLYEKVLPPQGETWVINEGISASSLPNTSINFISNEMNFSSLHYFSTPDNPATIFYGSVVAWSMGVWINEAYRTITFETPPTVNLLAWLQANAVKQ